MSKEIEEDILRSLRKISRAVDLHSRWLSLHFGLTGPQLVSLRVIASKGQTTASELASEISLSQATITGIVDRLATRQLLQRARDIEDRRVVKLSITEAGRALIAEAPSPLQERFTERLSALSPEKQLEIGENLRLVVNMMDGENIEADPVLSSPVALSGSDDVNE